MRSSIYPRRWARRASDETDIPQDFFVVELSRQRRCGSGWWRHAIPAPVPPPAAFSPLRISRSRPSPTSKRAPALDRWSGVGGLAAQVGRSVCASAVTPVSLWMSAGRNG